MTIEYQRNRRRKEGRDDVWRGMVFLLISAMFSLLAISIIRRLL